MELETDRAQSVRNGMKIRRFPGSWLIIPSGRAGAWPPVELVMYPVIECNPVRPAQKLPSWRPFLCSLIPAIRLQNRSLIIINVSVSVHIVQMALAFDGFIGQLKKLRLFTLTFTADLAEVITQSLWCSLKFLWGLRLLLFNYSV